jgi:hypothetical protein
MILGERATFQKVNLPKSQFCKKADLPKNQPEPIIDHFVYELTFWQVQLFGSFTFLASLTFGI